MLITGSATEACGVVALPVPEGAPIPKPLTRCSPTSSALRQLGLPASLSPDAVLPGVQALRDIPLGAPVVYRGWMLNAAEYGRSHEAIPAASDAVHVARGIPGDAPPPNWYPLIADFTPETRVLPPAADWEAELRSLGWQAFFIKDYVKSLKTSRGSVVRDPSEAPAVVAEMGGFRGGSRGGCASGGWRTSSPSRSGGILSSAGSGMLHRRQKLSRRLSSDAREAGAQPVLLGGRGAALGRRATCRRGWRRAGVRLSGLVRSPVRVALSGIAQKDAEPALQQTAGMWLSVIHSSLAARRC